MSITFLNFSARSPDVLGICEVSLSEIWTQPEAKPYIHVLSDPGRGEQPEGLQRVERSGGIMSIFYVIICGFTHTAQSCPELLSAKTFIQSFPCCPLKRLRSIEISLNLPSYSFLVFNSRKRVGG